MRNVVMQQGTARKLVTDLEPGDRVDLECDAIADAQHENHSGPGSEHPEFEFEYEIVERIERENPDCVRVEFQSGFVCGFPFDHFVDVDGEA